MKGKVFIGWSGDRTIAEDVQKKLENEEYTVIVGGDTRAETNLFLGPSIINEIDSCHQAIIIFQRKDDGSISSNAMFEFGYCLSRMAANKIHVFYIDIPEESIPADIKGIWATPISKIERDNVDDIIAGTFLSNQRKVYLESKMDLFFSYFELKYKFQLYSSNPFCSEYELAQNVLFFSQAAYMHNDVNEGLQCLTELADSVDVSGELSQSLRFSNSYLGIFINMRSDDNSEGLIYLDYNDFIKAKKTFNSILRDIENWPSSEFKTWVEILTYETLNYIHILGAACPGREDKRNALYENSIELADKCLAKCKELSSKHKDEQAVSLYKAYMFRNLSTAYKNKDEKDTEKAKEYLSLSFNERESLLEYYRFKTISSRIYDNFEMEYYLALSELLQWSDDPESFDENKELCDDYIYRVKKLNKEKTHYIRRIEQNIKKTKGGK